MTTAILVAASYLIGSIPFGYWLVRATKGVDIRRVGSGNIGASNVWRTYGWRYGVPVMLFDTAKGLVPALVATEVAGSLAGVLAGGAAMAGHARPLFLRFAKGGKTVATAGGAFLGVAPIVGLVGAGVWIVTFLLTRYASVASIAGACSLPLLAWGFGEPWPVIAFGAAAAAVVVVLHRQNVRRLFAGTESRAKPWRQVLRLRRATARAAPSSGRSP
jgi:glycerol-3-phosphate acyltransferase PlsY